jgi:hypothetical protein
MKDEEMGRLWLSGFTVRGSSAKFCIVAWDENLGADVKD